jgi:predicted Zn-dependent protease
MKPRFLIVLTLLGISVALATLRAPRSAVSLASLRQLWSDTLRDADQPGMRLTRLSDAEEMRLGTDLTSTMEHRWVPDSEGTTRVARVARPMLAHVRRRAIAYQFHAIDEPLINAFALPGGQIIVTTGMLSFVESDSELAVAIGHEIAHVDLRHAVEHYQYQYRLGSLVEIFHRLATMPFSADQELDADAEGLRLAIAGGYNAAAAPAIFARMERKFHEGARLPATTPAGELAQSLGDAMESYFRTHPPTEERARRMAELAARAATR